MGFGAGRRHGGDGGARPRHRARALAQALVAARVLAATRRDAVQRRGCRASPAAKRWSCWPTRSARALPPRHVRRPQADGRRRRLDADRHQERGAGRRRRPTPSSCAPGEGATTARHRPVPGRARAPPGVTPRGYPTQDGARAADLDARPRRGRRCWSRRRRPGRARARGRHRHRRALRRSRGRDGQDAGQLTVEYMNTRKQFGVTIATFQALRHRMADVKMQLELARSMSYYASLKLNEPAARAPPRAVAGQGAARPVDALRRPAVRAAARRHRRHRRVHRQPLLQAADGMEMTFGDTLHHLGEVSAAHAGHGRRLRLKNAAGPFGAMSSGLTAIAGLRVGHFTDARRPTGCTVVLRRKAAPSAASTCAAPRPARARPTCCRPSTPSTRSTRSCSPAAAPSASTPRAA